MRITTATAKGRRPYQEDRFITHQFEDGFLAAIFDGHGGEFTSELAADSVVGLWKNTSGQAKSRMSTVFRMLNKMTLDDPSGSTASIVWIPKSNRQAIIGIMGDSPILIKDSEGKLNLSPDHNVRTNAEEANAAMRRGGVIANGYLFADRFGDGLQMTRALGDKPLHSVLNRLPEIYSVKLSSKTSWILLGSDGLFDPGHSGKSSITPDSIAANIEINLEADDLVETAVNLPTHDNVTAILIHLK